MKRQLSTTALLCVAALAACDPEKNAVQDITGPLAESRIKFFNFGINAPAVNFYANDTKMTAILTSTCSTPPISETCTTTGSESTLGVGYGGVGSGGLYSAIEPGQYTLTGRIAATIDKDLPISTLSASIEAGKNYSYYQSGLYDATAKRIDAFVVEDAFAPEIDWSAAQVRFVHAIYNANPMTLHATNVETGEVLAIGSTVAYKAGGAFTGVPNGVYNLSTRYDASPTNVITRTGVSFVAGRIYTITARGDITVAPSTTTCASTNRTCLDNTLNR